MRDAGWRRKGKRNVIARLIPDNPVKKLSGVSRYPFGGETAADDGTNAELINYEQTLRAAYFSSGKAREERGSEQYIKYVSDRATKRNTAWRKIGKRNALLLRNDIYNPTGIIFALFGGEVFVVSFAGFFIGAFPVNRGAHEAGFFQQITNFR